MAGLAAGAYLIAALLEWNGRGRSDTARTAHLITFPLTAFAGLLLIVDLGRPERFWHMVVMSAWALPMLKGWSPISYGSWLVLLFSAWTFVSFVDSLVARRVLAFGGWWRFDRPLHGGPLGMAWTLVGAALAVAMGTYSGVLLATSNVPGWGQAPTIPAVYMATALVTGAAAVLLLQALRRRADPDLVALARVSSWLIALWLVVVAVFLATLPGGGAPFFLFGVPLAAIVDAIVLGGLLPLGLQLGARAERASGLLAVSAFLVLVGGFLLRFAIVVGPQYHVQP